MSALSSVHRALRVLETVAAAGDGITAKAVARRLEFNLSTTYHLIESLVVDGYLVRLDEPRGFGLGPKLPALHDRLLAQLTVPPGVGTVLREVHVDAGAAALYAAFRGGGDVVVVAGDDCPDHPVPVISTWRGALHATAVGKLLLAALPPAELRAVLDRDGLPAHAYRTLTDPSALERELAAVRRRGVATDRGEFRERLACVAAPVRPDGPGGEPVGAVAVAVPVVPAGGPGSLADRRDRLEGAVRAGAARLTRAVIDPASAQRDEPGWVPRPRR